MWGGYTGPGHKTIIPAEAHAKLTFRLVADQRPEDVGPQVRAWVEAHLPAGIEAEVHAPPGGVAPCASDLDSPGHGRPARAPSRRPGTATPADVLFLREGGSGPEADLVEAARRAAGVPRRRPARPTASTRRTSGSCCRCCTAAPRRPRTCGASSAHEGVRPAQG